MSATEATAVQEHKHFIGGEWAGIVHVNDQTVADEPQMPFGGVKDSGFGRFGGSAVIDEFTELRWITATAGSHPFPF